MSIRKLAERAGVSHTQVSRIESGEVSGPSATILVAIARALARNPLPLLVLARRMPRERARDELATLFRDGAELPEEWGEWASVSLEEARSLLRRPDPDEQRLRELAADVFSVAETDETVWRPDDALRAVAEEAPRELVDLIYEWRFIGMEGRRRLLEYARTLRRLQDLEYLVEVERARLEAEPVRVDRDEPKDAASGEAALRSEGFEGFLPMAVLGSAASNLPPTPGVYVVFRRATDRPDFLAASVGGHFKGRDPSMPAEELERKWVDGASTVYIGRTGNLRSRLTLLARFGRGEPVGHWGGRYLWQLADHGRLVVAWDETPDHEQRETELIERFHAEFGALPFANLSRPRAEARP